MPRIVLVGAGSVDSRRNLLGDILTSPALAPRRSLLHDIDAERLAPPSGWPAWTATSPRRRADDLRPPRSARGAHGGADFVINTIQVGGARATQIDFDVPASFGLRYTIADTVGVGGVFRGLRTVPVVLGIARDMEEICPDAWLLNYTNPLAILVRAVAEASLDPGRWALPFGLLDRRHPCRLPRLPRDESTRQRPGQPPRFVLRLEHRGRDLYPDLRAFVEAGRTPDDDLVRADLFRRLGFYPTESSEHHAEYSPWFIGKSDAAGDAVERFHIPIGEYLDRVAHNLEEYAETKRHARRGGGVRDRAQRRVRGRDRRGDDDRRAGTDRGQRDERRRTDPQPRGGRMRRGPRPGRRAGVHPVAMGPLPLASRRVHPAARSTCRV